jgi:hypothetical protein
VHPGLIHAGQALQRGFDSVAQAAQVMPCTISTDCAARRPPMSANSVNTCCSTGSSSTAKLSVTVSGPRCSPSQPAAGGVGAGSARGGRTGSVATAWFMAEG